MIDERMLIDELKFRVRTPRSTMEILRDIIPLVEMQPKIKDEEIRDKVIDEFYEKSNKKISEFVLEHKDNLDFASSISVAWSIIYETAEQMKKGEKINE